MHAPAPRVEPRGLGPAFCLKSLILSFAAASVHVQGIPTSRSGKFLVLIPVCLGHVHNTVLLTALTSTLITTLCITTDTGPISLLLQAHSQVP